MNIIPGKTYEKNGRKRYVIGIQGFFVIYRTVSNRPRTVGEMGYMFEKWLKGAVMVEEPQ